MYCFRYRQVTGEKKKTSLKRTLWFDFHSSLDWDVADFCMNNIHYLFNPLTSQPSGAACNLTDWSIMLAKEQKIYKRVTLGISFSGFRSLAGCVYWAFHNSRQANGAACRQFPTLDHECCRLDVYASWFTDSVLIGEF